MSVCIRQERAGTGKAAGVEDAGQWRSPKAVKNLHSPALLLVKRLMKPVS